MSDISKMLRDRADAHNGDRLCAEAADLIDRLTAERDAATAIAQAFEEAKALAADLDPARLVAYDWIESRAAMIRAQERQA